MQLCLAIVGSKFSTMQFYLVSIPKLIIHNAERILFCRHCINSYTTTGSVKVSKCLILTAVKIWSDWRISLLWHTVYSHILPRLRVTFHIGLRCVEGRMELKSHRQAAKTLILHFLIQSHPALRTSYYYGQFALSLRGKDLSFTQISTRLIRTLSVVPLVSVLTRFNWVTVNWP